MKSLASRLPLALAWLAAPLLLYPAGLSAAESEALITDALTFHASFDRGATADFAKGDPELYTVIAIKPALLTQPGFPGDQPDKIAVEQGEGRFGACIHFKNSDAPRIFFAAENNFPYQAANWQSTFSYWLRVTPDEDLAPGYTDPVQITPRSALDACFFTEFGIENPRPFRLGVFADLDAWNPSRHPTKEIDLSERPLITVENPPFSRDRWTHVVFTFEGFNNRDKDGVARLYLDGKPRGALSGWPQQFTWDIAAAQIRLGVKFVGRIDEVSCFNRALTASEVAALYALEGGVSPLLVK